VSGAALCTDVPLTGPRSVKVTALTRDIANDKVDAVARRVAVARLLTFVEGVSCVNSTVDDVGVENCSPALAGCSQTVNQ